MFTGLGFFQTSGLQWTNSTLTSGSSPARDDATVFILNNKLYVKGGHTSASANVGTLEQYDIVAGTWATKTAGFAARGSISTTLGTMSYVASGYNGSAHVTTFQAYDDVSNAWINKASITDAVTTGFAFNDGTYVYMGGGTKVGGAVNINLYRYNPSTNTWSTMTAPPSTNCGYGQLEGAFLIGDYYYIVGGWDGSAATRTVNRYSISGNSWTRMNDWPGTISRFGMGFAYNGKGYILTRMTSDIWEYDPSNDSWTKYTNTGVTFKQQVNYGQMPVYNGNRIFMPYGNTDTSGSRATTTTGMTSITFS